MAKIKITATSSFFTLEHTADSDEEALQVAEYIKTRHDRDVLLIYQASSKNNLDRDLTHDENIAATLSPVLAKARTVYEEAVAKARKGLSYIKLIPPESIILSVNFEKIKPNAI